MTVANSLLDFVMSVVRDPDVAAQYAANPAQAIADAHLDGVTSADVNGLIPVVSESLSTSHSAPASDAFGDAANVWSSGAATAAFDAFGDHPAPDQGHTGVIVDPAAPAASAGVVDTGADLSAPAATDPAFGLDSTPDAGPVDAFAAGDDAAGLDDWHHVVDAGHDTVADDQGQVHDTHPDPSGFDLFT
jgi:hypothetical protein